MSVKVFLVYGQSILNAPDLICSRKLSRMGLVSSWMGDRLGIQGAVGLKRKKFLERPK